MNRMLRWCLVAFDALLSNAENIISDSGVHPAELPFFYFRLWSRFLAYTRR